MRKDVKIGLAIGGVLLAVLIVYLLVPKDANRGDQLAQGDLSTSSPSETNAGDGGFAGNGNRGAGETESSGSTADRLSATGGQNDQPPAVADHQVPNTDSGAASGEEPSAGAGGGFDWDAMLSQGVMPDKQALMATRSQTPPGGATGAPGQTPTNDPFATDPNPPAGEEPVWKSGSGVTGGPTGAGSSAGVSTQGQQQPLAQLPSGGMRDHTVQQNETLSSIALAYYGDARHFRAIEKANPNLDPKRMRPGTVIKLPDPAVVKAGQASRQTPVAQTAGQQQPAVDPAREYVVRPGDSLYKISVRLYGRGDKADALYSANRDRIGDDSARLKIGTVIKLPEPPTVSPTATR